MSERCIFCESDEHRVITRRPLVYALRDAFAVTEGHCLVIPYRHVETIFDLTSAEIGATFDLLGELRQEIVGRDPNVSGFNVGANAGLSSGQTVMHCHIHLIPRRDGDVENPRGGVRWVIPSKADYKP